MISNFPLSFHNDGVFPGLKRFVADPQSKPVKSAFSALLRCSPWDEFRDICPLMVAQLGHSGCEEGVFLPSPRADPGLWLKIDQKRKHFERKRVAGRGDLGRLVK
jgi:hypothetical protein